MTTRLDNLSRRHLLQGIAGGGLVLGIEAAGLVAPFAAWAGAAKAANDLAPSVYLSIDEAGEVTIIEHRSEMGQGIRSSLPMVLADELEADWARVKVQQAVGDEARYGDQNTDGSRSIRNFYLPFRQAGAAARQMLEVAAAQRWGVAVDQVEARNHQVIHKPTGRALGYGELVATARDLPAPKADSLKLKPTTHFRYISKGVTGIDLEAMTTGRAKYGIDQAMPGMKYAVIARCPVYGGKVRSVDTSAALKVAGVERVVQLETTPPPSGFLPLGGVAVIARNTWAAIVGREQLKIDWDYGPNASYNSAAFRRELEDTARQPGKTMRNLGDAPAALANAQRRLTAEYYVPLLAHAPM
jgi:isoquinoline 1-oxidoreductase beta subunit